MSARKLNNHSSRSASRSRPPVSQSTDGKSTSDSAGGHESISRSVSQDSRKYYQPFSNRKPAKRPRTAEFQNQARKSFSVNKNLPPIPPQKRDLETIPEKGSQAVKVKWRIYLSRISTTQRSPAGTSERCAHSRPSPPPTSMADQPSPRHC